MVFNLFSIRLYARINERVGRSSLLHNDWHLNFTVWNRATQTPELRCEAKNREKTASVKSTWKNLVEKKHTPHSVSARLKESEVKCVKPAFVFRITVSSIFYQITCCCRSSLYLYCGKVNSSFWAKNHTRWMLKNSSRMTNVRSYESWFSWMPSFTSLFSLYLLFQNIFDRARSTMKKWLGLERGYFAGSKGRMMNLTFLFL